MHTQFGDILFSRYWYEIFLKFLLLGADNLAPGRPSPSFIQSWFPFSQWCYIPNLVTFCSAVLLKIHPFSLIGPGPKGTITFIDTYLIPLSPVMLHNKSGYFTTSSLNFSFNQLPLKNHWANFNQT